MNVVGRILYFGTTRTAAPAIEDASRTLTYGELARLIRQTARHLLDLGVGRGQRVGLCLKDTADSIVALLAIGLMGAIAVPLDWRARASENSRFVDALKLIAVLTAGDDTSAAGLPGFCMDDRWHAAVSAKSEQGDWPDNWHEPFVISATSGSTGAPKFTLMTHQQFFFAIAGMFELMGLSGAHRFLSTMPLYYSGGRNSCLTHLLRGDCVCLYPSLFGPDEYVETVRQRAITVAALVPSVVRQLLANSSVSPAMPGLFALFCTGAPLHAEEKRRAAAVLTPNFRERYGTAETMAVSVLRPADFAQRADSVGQPHSLLEIGVADDNDRALPWSAEGRLRMRGPGVGTPLEETNSAAQFRSGWYYPGEIARLDAEGYIYLHGRTSDVIIRGAAKVFPAEIEATLMSHPGVAEAAVLGRRGVDNEETIVAFIVPRGELALGDLTAHCRIKLSAHKVPRLFKLLEAMPHNTAGKIDKLALADLL